MGILARIVWFAFFLSCFAYVSFLILGSVFEVRGPSRVIIHDSIEAGRHVLSGMTTVDSPCEQLNVRITEASPTTYLLNISTWEEPYVPCHSSDYTRTFYLIAFAPSFGVQFLATINGRVQQIDYSWTTTKKKK